VNYNTSLFSETSPIHTRALTPSTLRAAFAQTALIWQLGWVLAWKPQLAMFLGRLVLRVRPNFRRA
jgi:hypothetical protein